MRKKFLLIFALFVFFILSHFNLQSKSLYSYHYSYVVFCYKFQSARIEAIKDSVEQKVDSLFSLKFNQMNKVLSNNETQHDGNIDRSFVYMLTFLSGIDCKTSDYTGFCFFSNNEYNLWLEWYEKNGHKIKWDRIQKALSIINKKSIKTEEEIEFLKKLKLE